MTLLAIALVCVAAVLHAFWNLVGKRQSPSAAFFLVASVSGAAALLPLLVRDRHVLALVPPAVWVLVVVTGVFEALYYAALAGAYRNGDMSVAYPLARALPVIMITVISAALALGKPFSQAGLAGIVAVAAGCLIVPLRSLSRQHLSRGLAVVCLLAATAAIGTTGYTLIDNEALRQMRALGGTGLGTIEITLVYLALGTLSSILWITPYIAFAAPERARLLSMTRPAALSAVAAGLVITLGYSMVLVAMAYASNVSYIAAFRQTSIPLGAALGIIVEKEKPYPLKLLGVAVILGGLILVAVA